MSGGKKILDGLKDAIDGNFTRVEMGGQAWIRVPSTTRHAGNAKAWALGQVNKRGWFHIRRVVWGRLMARSEKREGETIRAVTILVSAP